MRQVLWFRRDLRVSDSALLAEAKDHVLPIFIFDKMILDRPEGDDKRVVFIYKAVQNLKSDLQSIGLDLYLFYGEPEKIFAKLAKEGFDEVVASIDFDAYTKERDAKIAKILPLKRVYDSFLLHPEDILKEDKTPYRVFSSFYKEAMVGFHGAFTGLEVAQNLTLIKYVTPNITLEEMGFRKEEYTVESVENQLERFKDKINRYMHDRDYFGIDATSHMGVYLRFGLISIRGLYTIMIRWREEGFMVDGYIRQLFWREFFNYLLYHFPHSQFENFDRRVIAWREDREGLERWCAGKTGIPIIDAAMVQLKEEGWMHNRLRMLTASFLSKNLLIDWRLGEAHFAKYLLDYEVSSNVGSWQWVAGTGVDAAPYFRIFNPYTQTKRFDQEAHYIKRMLPQFSNLDAKYLHQENGVSSSLFLDYPKAMVDIQSTRKRAIETFKKARYATV